MDGRDSEVPGPTAAREVMVLRDADRPGSWYLVVDGTPQSHVDLADPTQLVIGYVRTIGHVVDLAAPPRAPLDVLHLGAGALTLARYVAATRPGSRQRAVDDDADLVERVRRELPWDRRAGIRVGIGDAREWLTARRDGVADLVVADVFAGARTPAHLTSVEFLREVARVLRPDGVYTANIGDGGALRHTRAQVATARAVFPHVAIVAEPGVLRGRRFGNVVLTAAGRDLPEEELGHRAHRDPDMARLLGGEELARFAAGAAPVRDADARPSPAPPPEVFTR
ncbi:spermidine synthase [Marinactinospora rubrisoli]|uniref:Spermidine synthase n=1 Tax=Marinactinospora rubrisoli TaxID=2715399 RepID=A0ABW2KJH2_9ACTN